MAKVLLVEDEEDLAGILIMVFESAGHTVIHAKNGQEGLAAIGSSDGAAPTIVPDVVVTDVMMPVMDGYTLVNHLLELDEVRKVPVLVMTASHTKDLFQASNIKGFIEKPFNPSELLKAVNSVLGK